MNNEVKEEGKGQMNWEDDSKEESDIEKKVERKKRTPAVNENLTEVKMNDLLDKYQSEHSHIEVIPLVFSGLKKGANRFYLCRALTLEDMNELNDLMSIFLEEEGIRMARAAKKQWLRVKKIEDEDYVPTTDEEKAEFEEFKVEYMGRRIQAMESTAYDCAINSVGVLFPEDHRKNVANRRGGAYVGDISNISIYIRAASGWSRVDEDIETYWDSEEDDDRKYRDLLNLAIGEDIPEEDEG